MIAFSFIGGDGSADKSSASFTLSDGLSPFSIVYKDVKKTSPSSPTYVLPKTGNE
ncbi:MAG: hypothetical protein IJ136_01150 [Erysipelotrichaceae bacterium]|nr:hypothetical protein [Erysipelotrichaceae bacterium]